jgi:hypothetical protein
MRILPSTTSCKCMVSLSLRVHSSHREGWEEKIKTPMAWVHDGVISLMILCSSSFSRKAMFA